MSEAPATPPTPHSLPAEIVALIATVVKHTRLRRAERAEIALELTAHFRDGLDSEKSPVELIAAFGDAQSAARGLRTGAIAKRSPMDRALRTTRIAASWCLLAFAGFYGGSIGYLWFNAPVISFDLIARFHARFPIVKPNEGAWPLYKKGLIALADPVESVGGITAGGPDHLQFTLMGAQGTSATPLDECWPVTSAWFRSHRNDVDALVLGASRPALGYLPTTTIHDDDADIFGKPPVADGASAFVLTFGVLMPELGMMRHAAKCLASDALVALEDGDGERFVDDIAAIIAVSHHVEEGELLISQLIGTAIRALAFDRIVMAMEWKPDALTSADLEALAAMLRAIPQRDYTLTLASEILMMEDFVQRTYSDDGAGDGYFNSMHGTALMNELTAMCSMVSTSDDWSPPRDLLSTISAPLSAAALASRKETMDLVRDFFERAESESKRQIWEQDMSFEQEFEILVKGSTMNRIKWQIPRLLMPAVARAAFVRRMGETESFKAQLAIALTQCRRAHGGVWPSAIDQLVPEYLAQVPRDPKTGDAIAYEVKDGIPKASSLGNGETYAVDPSGVPMKDPGRLVWFDADSTCARWRQSP